jgi:hypothetical protein
VEELSHPYQIECPTCRVFTHISEIAWDRAKHQKDPWDRVMMGCGCTLKLPRADVIELENLASGVIAIHVFPHPDRADGEWITVHRGPRIQ